jgi:acyl-CoA synthetase (AMP-forming)/AMP-acid ligase II
MLAPLSHIGGYAQLLLMLHIAGKIVMARPWNVSNALALIDREKVRSLAGATPAMLRELVRADRSGYDLSSLLSFNIHGVAVHDSLLADLTEAFPAATVGTGYGLTETCGSICVMAGAELLERPSSSGRVLPSVSVKLTDPAGAEVPMGQPGEITVRGAMVMQGYWGDAQQSAAALRDGWFRTGDLGRIDADGYLQVVDRFKDLIAIDDRQLSAAALERAAASFMGVEEAATLGVVSFDKQREVLIAVIVSENCSDMSGLCRHIRDRVGELHRDPRIVPCSEFPRTTSGKIDRGGLKRQILEAMAP